MKIGIIGTGRMGGGLGTLWATRRKHQLFFGSRKRIRADSLAQVTGPESRGGIYEEAAEYGDVVLLAIPWIAVEAVVPRLNPYLKDTVLLDITNPLDMKSGGFALSGPESGAEIIQSLAPNATVVKGFNGIYFDNLDAPMYTGGHRAQVYTCADDEDARESVNELITDLNFTPMSLGGLDMARHLEAMVYLWIKGLQAGDVDTDTVINIIGR